VSAGADISVSLVNTDNRELLLGCLRSLAGAAREISLQTIVIDNASTDGSADAVAEAFPDVELVRLDRRQGFGANHNQAIRRSRGRYVFILNEDTVLHEGALDRLCRFMDQNPGVGAAGPRILYPDGSEQPAAFHFPTPGRVAVTTLTLQRALWRQSGGDAVRPVDWLCGAAILARRDALEAVGGFDESLFIYSEDPDLCLRMRAQGFRSAYFPHASLVHHENATTTSVHCGCVAIATMPAATKIRTVYGRRFFESSVLKLRKRIVLTISSAGTTTIASAGTAARMSVRP